MTPSRCGVGFAKTLADFDGLYGLLFLIDGHLRDDDVEDAVFDLGADLLLVDVFRQHHGLADSTENS